MRGNRKMAVWKDGGSISQLEQVERGPLREFFSVPRRATTALAQGTMASAGVLTGSSLLLFIEPLQPLLQPTIQVSLGTFMVTLSAYALAFTNAIPKARGLIGRIKRRK